MNDNIKALIQLMDEHPDLPVIPVVGQGVVSDCIGEWAASFGAAEIKMISMSGGNVFFREVRTAIDALEALEHEGISVGQTREESLKILSDYLDKLDWLEAIIVHIETPTVAIPDNTEKIYETGGINDKITKLRIADV